MRWGHGNEWGDEDEIDHTVDVMDRRWTGDGQEMEMTVRRKD